MNVLVTGGSGTIGGYVLRELLRAGHEATCFSRTAPRVKGVRFITGDVTNIEDIEKACDGISYYLLNGIKKTMNEFNEKIQERN